MTLITDGLLIAAAIFAGTYCFVLSRRLRALKDLDSGVGAAIMRMTRALEDARRALEDAKTANSAGNHELKQLIVRAEAASGQLRILLSATRDLPAAAPRRAAANPAPATRPREDEDEIRAESGRDHQPAAPVARREPLPIAAPRTPAPALDPLDRAHRRPAAAASPLRRRAAPAPASEDDLLAALADFAGAKV